MWTTTSNPLGVTALLGFFHMPRKDAGRAAKNLRDAMTQSMRLDGHIPPLEGDSYSITKTQGKAMGNGSDQIQPVPERVTRVIDFRIPLPWLLSGAGVMLWGLVSMYFAIQQLTRDVADMQITLKTGNTQSSTIAGQVALLQFRLDNVEKEMARNSGVPLPQPPVRR